MAITKIGQLVMEARKNGNVKTLAQDDFEARSTFDEYKRDCYHLYTIIAKFQGEQVNKHANDADMSACFDALKPVWLSMDSELKADKGDILYLAAKIFRTAKIGTIENGTENILKTEKLVSESAFRKAVEVLAGYRFDGMVFDGANMVKRREEEAKNKKEKREAAKKAAKEAEAKAKEAAEAEAKAAKEAADKEALEKENAAKREANKAREAEAKAKAKAKAKDAAKVA